MFKKFLKKEEEFENAISEEHISAYLDRVGRLLFWTLLFIFVIEVLVIVFSSLGFFPTHLSIHKTRDGSYKSFVLNIIIQNGLSWLVLLIYTISFKRVGQTAKKVLVCVSYLAITTIFCFGLWRFSYLSFLYVLPILLTCPLGRKYRLSVFIVSLIMSLLYSLYQQSIMGEEFNFLINSVSLIALVSGYLINRNIYHAFSKALLDINEYSIESVKLHDNIAHDFLTGAFSKTSLYDQLSNNQTYKSIAFIDLDNFKDVNDSRGHSVGDDILKLLVISFKSQSLQIFRYGGDEFVVLSHYSQSELAEAIETVKTTFINSAKQLVGSDVSFSAGISVINFQNNIDEIIRQCDQLMYRSKNNGKNQIIIS